MPSRPSETIDGGGAVTGLEPVNERLVVHVHQGGDLVSRQHVPVADPLLGRLGVPHGEMEITPTLPTCQATFTLFRQLFTNTCNW